MNRRQNGISAAFGTSLSDSFEYQLNNSLDTLHSAYIPYNSVPQYSPGNLGNWSHC